MAVTMVMVHDHTMAGKEMRCFSGFESIDKPLALANAYSMQITIDLDEHLVEEAEKIAARGNRSLSAFVEDALREVFARMKMPRKPVQLPTSGGGGLRPGVNISNSAELL